MDRGGEESFESAAGAFSEHRHAGDEEHGDEREHSEQRHGPPVEHVGVGVEDEPQQGELDGRQGEDEHHGAAVVHQLDEDPAGGANVMCADTSGGFLAGADELQERSLEILGGGAGTQSVRAVVGEQLPVAQQEEPIATVGFVHDVT